MIHRMMVCLLVAIGALWFASGAAAADCGEPAKGGGEPLKGSLLLAAEESTTELSFKRDRETKSLIFNFDVKDCRLPEDTLEGAVVKIRSSDPEVEEAFGAKHVEAEGSTLTVQVEVDPEKFDPGKHTASVTVRGAGIDQTRAKATVQRTTPWVWPTLFVVVLALVAWAYGLHVGNFAFSFRGDRKDVLGRWLGRPLGAIVAATAATFAVWWSGYAEAEVWEWGIETAPTLAAGVLAAAYGATSRIMNSKKDAGA